MSIIGLIEFLGGAVLLCMFARIAYRWFGMLMPEYKDDAPGRFILKVMAVLTGVALLATCVLVLVLFMALVFPATVR